MARWTIFKSRCKIRWLQIAVLKEQFVRLNKEGRNRSKIADINGYDPSTIFNFFQKLCCSTKCSK